MLSPAATKRQIQNLKRRHGTSEVSCRRAQPATLLPPTLFLNLDRWTWTFVQDKWTYWNVATRVDTTFNIGRKAGKDIIIPTLKMKCQGLGVVEQPPKLTR